MHGLSAFPLPNAEDERPGNYTRYWASVTCSSQSTVLLSSISWMAVWVMAVVGDAPCQCFRRVRTR